MMPQVKLAHRSSPRKMQILCAVGSCVGACGGWTLHRGQGLLFILTFLLPGGGGFGGKIEIPELVQTEAWRPALLKGTHLTSLSVPLCLHGNQPESLPCVVYDKHPQSSECTEQGSRSAT